MNPDLQKSDKDLLANVDKVINTPNTPNIRSGPKKANILFSVLFSIGIFLLILIRALRGHNPVNLAFTLIYVLVGLLLLGYLFYMAFFRKELPLPWGWLIGRKTDGKGAYIICIYYLFILLIVFVVFWPGA